MGNLKMAWFPFLENKRGSTGTLVQAESYVPSHSGVLIYFSTGDISGVLQRVREKGGKVITERMSIGEYGFVGHFEDSEGNRVGLHSRK
jgi:predicted enzyme related to lactoylglutathione lyase